MLLAGAVVTAFAADSPMMGAWQLDSEQSAQAALYLFTPTRYSMVWSWPQLIPRLCRASSPLRPEGKTLPLRQARNARGVAADSAPTFKFVRVE